MERARELLAARSFVADIAFLCKQRWCVTGTRVLSRLAIISQHRKPGTFSEIWTSVNMYERVSAHNRWDPNGIFYLKGNGQGLV